MGLSNFLRCVREKLLKVLRAQPDDVAKESAIPAYEELSHFIFDTRHFSRMKAMVKPSAFVPYPENRVSAFWIDELSEPHIWKIGDEVAGQSRGKPAAARADFKAGAVLGLGLTIEADPEPHPRHVDVCGWPAEKDEQKEVALELCAASTLRIR
jgi:hypothetical protein